MGKSAKDYCREIDGRKYSADELSAIILKKVKQDAERGHRHDGLACRPRPAARGLP